MQTIIKKSPLLSFGDSFTFGSLATANNGYAPRLANALGGTFSNYGLGGSVTTYSTRKALEVLPEGYRRQVVTWMSGLNDIRKIGTPAITKIEGNLRAFLAACFLDDCLPASALRRFGTWNNNPNDYGGKAFACGGFPLNTSGNLNASLSYDFYGDNVVIGAWRTNGNPGHYHDLSISVDGAPDVIFPLYGNTDELTSHDALILRGLGAGPHTVVIKPTTSATYTVVDYVGTLSPNSAPVFVGLIPNLLNWAQYNSVATQEIADATSAAISSVVAEFDGYPIEIVDTNQYYDPVTQCTSDGIHPGDAGHEAIKQAFLDRITIHA